MVPAGTIKTIFAANENPWFKRTHVERFLDVKHIHTSMEKLESKETCTRDALGTTCRATARWSRPKDPQNKTDEFLSVYGEMYAIVNSRNKKEKCYENELRHYFPES